MNFHSGIIEVDQHATGFDGCVLLITSDELLDPPDKGFSVTRETVLDLSRIEMLLLTEYLVKETTLQITRELQQKN